MDVPLSSDVLDVDIAGPSTRKSSRSGNHEHEESLPQLAVASLVSGKVVLIDYSKLASSHAEGASQDVDDYSDEGSSREPQRQKKLYTKPWNIKPGSKSCRASRFTDGCKSILSISKDRTVSQIDVEAGTIVHQWRKAHDAAPSCLLPISHDLFATGDDDGVIKMWDPRVADASSALSGQSKAQQTYAHHSDWVTDMIWQTNLKPSRQNKRDAKGKTVVKDDADGVSLSRSRLIAVAGDGLLSVIDPRAGKKGVECSEDQEDELLSIRAIKGGDKMVVGTALGPLSIWAPSKGLLDHVDRLAGHPTSVDSIDVLDEDTILTASSDGLVRVVQVYPHKLLGVAADHGGFPVERAVHAGDWLASVGHESFVRFTSLKDLLESDDEDADAGSDAEEESSDEPEDEDDSSTDEDTVRPGKSQKMTHELKEATAPEPGAGFFAEL